jgi:Retinal pigment epithelial membrane protein
VLGKLPPELDGMFVRNGPNPQFPPIKNYHVFEGDGMLLGASPHMPCPSHKLPSVVRSITSGSSHPAAA